MKQRHSAKVEDIQKTIREHLAKVKAERLPAMPGSNWPLVERQEMRDSGRVDVNGCPVDLFYVDRPIWPDVPKARLIQYYHAIAPYILPYLKDRPLTLMFKLAGPMGEKIVIKDMEGRQPKCAKLYSDRRRHPQKGKRSIIDYLICNNLPTLLWMINLGCIDVNPWNARIANPEFPDYVVLDLDPSETADFKMTIEVAMVVKKILDKLGVQGFAKTSGKSGLHYYVPCLNFTWQDARNLARSIFELVNGILPDLTTFEERKGSRGARIYLDAGQNDYASTMAAVYSARPNHIPTVSTPLQWSEINRRLKPEKFTIDAIPGRITKMGDLFQGVLDRRIARANNKALLAIQSSH